MSPSKEIQNLEPDHVPPEQQQEPVQIFTNTMVNVIVTIMVIVAFLPSILDSSFYEPLWRFVLMISLGVCYGLVGTFGAMRQEATDTRWSFILYFSLQLTFLFALFYLGKEIDNNFWLLMLPLSAQALSRGWGGVAVISTVQIVGFWIIFQEASIANLFDATLSIATAMLIAVLFTYIAVREGTARFQIERLAADLRRANQRLAEYAAQIEELATMRERNRLAREIHDNLGHYLTIVNVQIEAARTVMDHNPQKAADALQKAQRLTQEGLSSVRQSVSALRESPLGERPLSEAITALAAETEAAGIATPVTIHGEPRALDAKIELTLYRAVQEALTNARKHAQAARIVVTLDYRQPQRVILSVADNGRGAAETSGGFGLLGLQERIHLLNGRMSIETAPEAGFHLHVAIPIPEEAS